MVKSELSDDELGGAGVHLQMSGLRNDSIVPGERKKSIVAEYYDTIDKNNPQFLDQLENRKSLKTMKNALGNKKIYTELLCNRKYLDSYVQKTTRQPAAGSGSLRGMFRGIYRGIFGSQNAGSVNDVEGVEDQPLKPSERSRRMSVAEDRWHAAARWVKYLEILESEGHRWSKPHVTTLCPYYIHVLRKNLKICHNSNDLFEFERASYPYQSDEIYQPIYLSDDGSENLEVSVRVDPAKFKWVVENGTPHDRFEVGRCIGGIFSCEQYRGTIADLTLNNIRQCIDEFLHHSTLVPFNSWDPRFRMQPINVDDSTPSWLDPDLGRDKLPPKQSIEGGILDDLKHKGKFYLSDWIDFFNMQCISTVLFMFFVNITPIITFGALTQAATLGQIGAIESIVGASMCGIIFSLFGGQPLIIVSQTGPMLVFDKILFQLCNNFGIEFLPFRMYVGIFTAIILFVVVFARLSKYVTLITRFTEESFALLISLIFISDGIKKIMNSTKVYGDCSDLPNFRILAAGENSTQFPTCTNMDSIVSSEVSSNGSSFTCTQLLQNPNVNDIICQPTENEALWCGNWDSCAKEAGYFGILLSIMTLIIAINFQKLRATSLFPTGLRNFICNFGVIITITICLIVDWLSGVATEKLEVPKSFQTTIGRDWLVPLRFKPVWFAYALLPALLCSILVVLDQQITAVICNRKDNKLKKGVGYHLDLFVVGCLMIPCAMLGLPWYVAATVRSMAHIQSLKIYDTANAIPGQPPKFIGVIEQRGTGLCIFILIGVSVFLSKFLAYIPLNILYGVFVLMGINALFTVSITERLLLWITPVKHQPDTKYLRKVDLKMVHLFTFIQVVCLLGLFAVKSSGTMSILFPVMILMIVIVRKLLEYIYSPDELNALDG